MYIIGLIQIAWEYLNNKKDPGLQGKNFIYSNFCKIISNMLSENIIWFMTANYGEYFYTRKKLSETSLNE